MKEDRLAFLKLILGSEFYEKNKSRLVEEMFPDQAGLIYQEIVKGHRDYSRDLTLDEVRSLVLANNPTLTRASKTDLFELFTDIEDAPKVGADVASDLLSKLWQAETGRRISALAIDLMEGRSTSLTAIATIIEAAGPGFLPGDVAEAITDDLDELLDIVLSRPGWHFCIKPLHDAISMGIGGGEFAIFSARPEAGKTAFWVTLAAGPGGWAEQGATVHALCNEEPAFRTQLRAYSCYTGLTREEIFEDRDKCRSLYSPIKGRVQLFDAVGLSVDDIEAHVQKYRPDILIIDQIDKIQINGDFARGDERLRELYIRAREIAKRYKMVIIGISQLSADAEGKSITSYSMLEGSKTGKAAEADLMIGIGVNSIVAEHDNSVRTLSLQKNKLSGVHKALNVVLSADISRYHE